MPPLLTHPGQTDVRGGAGPEGAAADDDFLARERAVLGDDADQFVTVEDAGDDDLLGGGDDGEFVTSSGSNAAFESSFPAIDTSNNVSDELDTHVRGQV